MVSCPKVENETTAAAYMSYNQCHYHHNKTTTNAITINQPTSQ